MPIYGTFNSPSGIDGFEKSYEDNTWTKESVRLARLTSEDVLATQALVMKILQNQDRSVLRGEKRHAFVALNNVHSDNEQLYDGSLEEYMACRVAKVAYDQWRMRIRFRQNELSQETNQISYLEDFTFDWLKNGNVQAWCGNIAVQATPEGTYEDWRGIRPIDSTTLQSLHERIEQHMNDITPSERDE